MKHKHSEVIKAFVDGIECQCWVTNSNEWIKIISLTAFDYYETVRIKPEQIQEKEEYYPEDTFDKKYLYVYNSLSRRESWLSEKELNMSATYGWQYMGKVEVTK